MCDRGGNGRGDCAGTSAAARGGGPYNPPRTPWGDPDLQGIWPGTDMVGVPVRAADSSSARGSSSPTQELKEREAQAAKQAELDVLDFDLRSRQPEIVALGDVGGVTSPPPHWLERGVPSRQSSLIVEPANGRMPAMTAGRRRAAEGQRRHLHEADRLEQRRRSWARTTAASRAAWSGSMMPVVYNNGNEIIQAPGYVAFRNEMIHETRIIPLDGRPTPPAHVKSYMGESRGHFEGNTLVVRTTNLNGRTGMQGNGMMLMPSDALELVERFTPVSADVLQYEVTVNDPKTWTQPWKVAFPLKRESDYQIFEYACHEGNNAMRNILSGSRADEKRRGSSGGGRA